MSIEVVLHSFADGCSGIIAARFSMPIREEIGLAIAVVLTFAGMILNWHLPRQRMAMEERMKDGKLTERQARQRMKLFAVLAPVTTLAGVAMLIGVLLAFVD